MLTQLKASSLIGKQIILPILQDNTSGFTVRSVEGLNPTQASIVTSTFALLDGSKYQASSVDNRNIVVTVGLEPFHGGLTVKQLRDQLYSVFMPKNQVNLVFYDHSLADNSVFPYETFGYVESFETNLFSNDPEVIISILCTEPFFKDIVDTVVNGTTVQNVSTTDINYTGTSPVGFTLELPITVPDLTNIIVYRELPFSTLDTFEIRGETGLFAVGDVFKLSTVIKKKTVTRVRSNIEASILYAMDPISRWVDLYPGVNKVRVYTNVGAMPYVLTYRNYYGGL